MKSCKTPSKTPVAARRTAPSSRSTTTRIPRTRQPPGIEQLVQQLRETADKLLRDGATCADVKLLNTALKELRYSFKIFTPYRTVRKVTVFGSARLPAANAAYQQAVEFGRRIAAAGWMVITGAASGIMEAGMVGAGREKSIGVNILLPFEQEANPIIRGDLKLMNLKYFFTRKLLVREGGRRRRLVPRRLRHPGRVLRGDDAGADRQEPYISYRHGRRTGRRLLARWRDYIHGALLGRKLISPADMALFKVTDSLDEAVSEILGFYRVYHSMRYVGPDLVLRLQKAPPPALLERIRTEFRTS